MNKQEIFVVIADKLPNTDVLCSDCRSNANQAPPKNSPTLETRN